MSRLTRLLRSFLLPGSLQTRAAARWCAVDPTPGGAYNDRFLRHRCDDDFIGNPEFLWSPGPYWAARAGLDAHLRLVADQLAGAVYADALIVLHPEDHARSRRSMLRSWDAAAERELGECWTRAVQTLGWTLAMPGRQFHLRVHRDGDAALGGPLGLQPGEFATAFAPNLHLGPDPDATPLVEVFVAGPDGRFRSVGTMHSDQLAFSLGRHPLDNGHVEELGGSCVYSVHRLPGEEGLHHRVGPGHEGRVRLETGQALGVETIRVVDAARGKVLAEVMLVAARHLAAQLDGRREGPRVALPSFSPLALSIAPGTILPGDLDLAALGALSIVPEALPDRAWLLVERGTLLQRLHFRQVMRGYTLQLDRDGRWSPKVADPLAQVEVTDARILLRALGRDLAVDGRPLAAGTTVPLDDGPHGLTFRGGALDWQPLRRASDPKWPYLGGFSAPRRVTPLPLGGSYSVGRDSRGCDVPLPDRAVVDNIDWVDGQAAGPIAVHGGSAERATFRTDAICVATRAASFDLRGAAPSFTNLSGTCPLHVLRADGETVRLGRDAAATLRPGDELCIGNQLFSLLAPGEEEEALRFGSPRVAVAVSPAPRRRAAVLAETGRRAAAGGRPLAPVAPHRTLGALLGVDPARERSLPRIGPEDSTPTEQLPSLALDPTTSGEGLTIIDGLPVSLPARVDLPALPCVVPPPGILPRGLRIETHHGVEDAPRVWPRPSRRPARNGLPGFGPVPRPRSSVGSGVPSQQGD